MTRRIAIWCASIPPQRDQSAALVYWNLVFFYRGLDRRLCVRLIVDEANELRGLDVVDGPGGQMLLGRLLCHIVIVTANGTKQPGGRATLAPRGSERVANPVLPASVG